MEHSTEFSNQARQALAAITCHKRRERPLIFVRARSCRDFPVCRCGRRRQIKARERPTYILVQSLSDIYVLCDRSSWSARLRPIGTAVVHGRRGDPLHPVIDNRLSARAAVSHGIADLRFVANQSRSRYIASVQT